MALFSHIINPVPFTKSNVSHLNIAQPVTFLSMAEARRCAEREGLEVDLFSVQLKGERSKLPEEFLKLPPLKGDINSFYKFAKKQKPLPRIYDILNSLYKNSYAKYFIYTNVDIGVHPDFYIQIYKILNDGYDAIIVNRRDIPKGKGEVVFTSDDLKEIYSMPGKRHPGKDCFIFRRDIFKKLILKNVCIGAPPIGSVLAGQIQRNSNNLKFIKNGVKNKMTFHLGSDRAWKNSDNKEIIQYNKEQGSGLW